MTWKNGIARVQRRVYDTDVDVRIMVADRWDRVGKRFERTGWHVCISDVSWYHIDCQSPQEAIAKALDCWGKVYATPKDPGKSLAELEADGYEVPR